MFLLCSGKTKCIKGAFRNFRESGIQWSILFNVVSWLNHACIKPSCPKFVIIPAKCSKSVVQKVVGKKPNNHDYYSIQTFAEDKLYCVPLVPVTSHVMLQNFGYSLDCYFVVNYGSAHVGSFLINFRADVSHVCLFATIPNEFGKIEQHGTQSQHKRNPLVILVVDLFVESLIVLSNTRMNVPYLKNQLNGKYYLL